MIRIRIHFEDGSEGAWLVPNGMYMTEIRKHVESLAGTNVSCIEWGCVNAQKVS